MVVFMSGNRFHVFPFLGPSGGRCEVSIAAQSGFGVALTILANGKETSHVGNM